MQIIIKGKQGEGKTKLKSFIYSMLHEYGISVDINSIECGEYERGQSDKVIEFLQETSDQNPITIKEEQI